MSHPQTQITIINHILNETTTNRLISLINVQKKT